MKDTIWTRGDRPLARAMAGLATATLLVGLVAGCGGKQAASAGSAGQAPAQPREQSSKAAVAYDKAPAEAQAAPAAASGNQPAKPAESKSMVLPPSGTRLTQQKIIKNAELSLEVKDVAEAIQRVETATDTVFGVVTDSQLSGSDGGQGKGERRANLMVRVPGDQFNRFLADVQKLGKLLNHRVFTEDVSGQFVDLEARRQSALQHEKRLLDILARGNTVDELLKLENELNRVRTEIESITGRLNMLRDRVDFSTIRLALIEPAAPTKPDEPKPKTVWQQAIEAFLSGAKAVGEFAAALIVFAFGIAPVAFAVGVLALLLWPLARRLRGPGHRLATGPVGPDAHPGDR